MVFRKTETDLQRFQRSYEVDANSGCWLWTRSRFQTGMHYAQFTWMEGKKHKNGTAHRWVYQHLNGLLPPSVKVCHTCDIPHCVNPDHLFTGTQKDNQADMANKGRAIGFRRKGTKHPLCRLSEREVVDIRSRYAAGGVTQRELATTYYYLRYRAAPCI
ncbi:hypothetical protein LCGC14_2219670 [marine sediment metagenome]|uniref:HNH nuclease domain-containing protein n=1 Tax=marine sediment metagenome TaxID=412755 RepID=A0A0F9DBH5_9ZZZZ